MQAIQTKFLGPTNHKPARIKATCDAGTVTVSWDYGLSHVCNHEAAAKALGRKLEAGTIGGDVLTCRTVCGCLPDGSYAHVFTGEEG